MDFDGFDWDEGNWPKCNKHGVSQEEIEAVLLDRETMISPDPAHSIAEAREIAIGSSPLSGKPIAIFFTRRTDGEDRLVRPFSARFMHLKEFQKYERTRTE